MTGSYKESNIRYKYAEIPEEPVYKKKKKPQKIKKSNHKHHYAECLYDSEMIKGLPYRYKGTYCTICGRIGDIRIGREIVDDHTVPVFTADVWKDKFVTLPEGN